MGKVFHIKDLAFGKRVFALLLLLVNIPVLLLGLFSGILFIHSERTQLNLRVHSYYKSIEMDYESIFTQIRQYYNSCVQEESYKWLGRQTEIPYSECSNLSIAQNHLEGPPYLKAWIERYSYINVRNGWILGRYGMAETGELLNKEEYNRFIQEIRQVETDSFWKNYPSSGPRVEDRKGYQNYIEFYGVNLIIKSGAGEDGLPKNVILVQLSQNELKKLIRQVLPEGYECAVLDRQGNAIMETIPGLAGAFGKEHKNAEVQSYTWKSEDGEKYFVEQGDLSANGFYYLIGYNQQLSQKNANKFIFLSVGMACFMVFLLSVVQFTARYIIKPVEELELRLREEKEQYQTNVLASLVRGVESREYLDQTLTHLQISSDGYFRLMVVGATVEDGLEGDVNGLMKEILDDIPDMVNEYLLLPAIVYHKRLIFLFYGAAEAETDKKLTALYYTLKDVLSKYVERGAFRYGASSLYTELEYTRRAFGQASSCLEEQNESDEEGLDIQIYDSQEEAGQVRTAYDVILEKEMLQMIRQGEAEHAGTYLRMCLEKMTDKNLKGMERQFCLTKLILEILGLVTETGASLETVLYREREHIFERILFHYGREELYQYIYAELIVPIAEYLQKTSDDKASSEIVKEALSLIKEKEGDITLSECADQLGYHPTYITRLVKKEMSQSFTEICNLEKLNKAKTLLLTTEYSVAQIAELLRYNNSQNFIRFFSKCEGTTPAKYRKEHRG